MAVREIGTRVKFVDPNEILDGVTDNPGVNGYMSPPEDLCISLNLEAVLSDRNSCGMVNADGTTTRVFTTSFIGKASYLHGTDGTLTTKYTDASYKKDGTDTNECFGIQSVSVSFDMGTAGQAFSPNVVIKFIDVRGISVMSPKENDENGSFYRALFMFPSPLFKLSIKGFYGCEITYNLALSHPVRIDFDSSTGNFEITASFKGYMFGVYNDLPLSYAVISPFMDYVGRDYWDNQIKSGKFVVFNDKTKVPMIKYPEFREKVATISANEKSKQAETFYQQSLSYADMEKIDAYKLIDRYPLKDWIEKKKIIYKIATEFSESSRASLRTNISDFLESVNEYDNNKSHSVRFGDTYSFLKKYSGENSRLIEVFQLIRQENKKEYILKSDNASIKVRYAVLQDEFYDDIIQQEGNPSVLYVWVIDKDSETNVDDAANGKIKEIDNLSKKAKEEYQKTKNRLIAEALGFPPTIENLYRMMFAHMETFMKVFYNCTSKIKSQMDGNDAEKRNVSHYDMSITETDSDNSNGILPPFPMFVKNKTYGSDSVGESIWIGDLDNGADLEETKFVESLISASKLYSEKNKIIDANIRRLNKTEDNSDDKDGNADITDKPYKNKDLKHSTYLTLKNLYDRWLCSTPESRWRLSESPVMDTSDESGYSDSDYDNFAFIDTFYHNIGQRLIIDSTEITNLVSKALPDGGLTGEGGKIQYDNHSIYEYLYEVASGCGGNLVALPVMYGIKNNAALGKMFKVLPYDKKSLGNASMTYAFIYDYKSSEQLATGQGKKDDSFMLTEEDLLPSALTDNDGNYIPAFGVTYAKQNQALFKNISFKSDKPGVTDRSLAKTMSITQTNSKGPRETHLFGQDIYGVYSSMQYECSVEMMGNAQIMPMMYFQLSNIPYWKGTYMVTGVSHEIVPGNMTTTFKGIRINRNAIPMVSGSTITLNDGNWKIPLTNKKENNYIMSNMSNYPDNPVIKVKNENDYRQSMAIRDRLMRELGWKDYMAAALIGCVYGEAGGFRPWMVNVGEKSGSLKSSSACYKGPRTSSKELEHYDAAYSYGAGIIQFTFWDRKLRAATIVAKKNGGKVHGMAPEQFLMAIDEPGRRTCINPSPWQKATKVSYPGGIENLTLDEQFDILIGEIKEVNPAINESVKRSTNLQEALAVIYCNYIGGTYRKVEIPSPEKVQRKVYAYMRANPNSSEKDHYMKRLGYAKNFC